MTTYATFGDSKTWTGLYQPTLSTGLTNATATPWGEVLPRTMAHNGFTLSQIQLVIDADLLTYAALPVPQVVLCNAGANDVSAGLPTEAQWKSRFLYCIDAIHTQWADAQIYIMRPWRRTFGTECNTLATWIADIVASRAFVHLGPDERVFLENGDDGATYTADGIHPNAAGYALTGTQWQTTLGY